MSDIPKARAILQSIINSPAKLKRKIIAAKINEAIACMSREPLRRPRAKPEPILTVEEKKKVYAFMKANPHKSFDDVADYFGTSRTRVRQSWDFGEAGKL